jgi:hypothetical protein
MPLGLPEIGPIRQIDDPLQLPRVTEEMFVVYSLLEKAHFEFMPAGAVSQFKPGWSSTPSLGPALPPLLQVSLGEAGLE